ncbi:hypothetical protein HPB51_029054 [Rhipicephalus microplus]|uniref:Secreted protein n=1 Tax=Rhipicephalus microplus TaxID=6941 RepID=A0A9J6CVL4_RHIMP|nr:hypothetical protein HPB51_029054 [Rhipicephalus microplus]
MPRLSVRAKRRRKMLSRLVLALMCAAAVRPARRRGRPTAMQEPGGSGEEILNGIRYVRPGNNFQPNFPLFQKMDVNGDTQHPLFELLKVCKGRRRYAT